MKGQKMARSETKQIGISVSTAEYAAIKAAADAKDISVSKFGFWAMKQIIHQINPKAFGLDDDGIEFDVVTPVDDDTPTKKDPRHDPKWQEQVMNKLYPSEMKIDMKSVLDGNGNPQCDPQGMPIVEEVRFPYTDGFKRLVEELFGPIKSTTMSVIQSPNGQNRSTATVQVEITYHDKYKGCDVTVTDVADASSQTGGIRPGHETASAATRARGRIYRQILGICHVYTDEEIKGESSSTDDKMKPGQKVFCINQCNKVGVDPDRFFQYYIAKMTGVVPEDENVDPLDAKYRLTEHQGKELTIKASNLQNDEETCNLLKEKA
jgi:hypothetical protein